MGPVLIVGAKIWFDQYLYADLNSTWLLIQVLIGISFVAFGARLSKQFADQNPTLPFLIKVVNNISRHDVPGRNIVSAMTFLHDVEAFEQEP
jgi:hypothetical protein